MWSWCTTEIMQHFCKETMILLYHALIKPYLLNAIIIWGSTCSTYKNSLRVLQNSAVRVITGFQQMQHISSAYSKFGILKLDDLYRSGNCKFHV